MNIYKNWANNLLEIRLKELEVIVNSDIDISVAGYRAIETSLKEQYDKFIKTIDIEIPYISSIEFLLSSAYKIAEFTDAKNIYIDKPDFKLENEIEKRVVYFYNFYSALFYHDHAEYNKAIEHYKQMLDANVDKSASPIADYEVAFDLGLTYTANRDHKNAINILENLFTYFLANEKVLLANKKIAGYYFKTVNILSSLYRCINNYHNAIYFARIAVYVATNQPKVGYIDYSHLLISYKKALDSGLTIYKEKNKDGTIIEYDIASELTQTTLNFNQQLKNIHQDELSNILNYMYINAVILTRNIEVAQKLIKQNIKTQASQQIEQLECLYQYKSISNAKKAIINQAIYLNNPTNFNDYTDPFYRLFDDEYSKMAYNEAMDGLGIACLTIKNNNLLMWSHYADSHKGVCIKYKIPSELNNDRLVLSKVSYTNKHIVMNGEVFTDTRIDDNYVPVSFVEQLSTKSREWRYENEYRIICWNDTEEDRVIKAEIEAVYMGKEISNEDNKILQMLAKEYHFELYQMKTNHSNLRSLKEELVKI